MDLANLICRPQNPKCNLCPVSLFCLSKGRVFEKQKRKKKKNKITIAFLVKHEKYLLLEKTSRNLLQNLYSFPLSDLMGEEEGLRDENDLNKITKKWMIENNIKTSFRYLTDVEHTFSHFHLKVLIVELRLDKKIKFKDFFWLNLNDLDKKPVSNLMRKIKEKVL
jgi:A/G-specific adenine glycosylase